MPDLKKILLRPANGLRIGNHKLTMKYIIAINQNGNALWLVLVAVALLGFLAGVVSKNSSSVNQTGSIEQARIKATSLLRYSKSVETAVQQMLLNGISENDLDFVAISGAHDNVNCTTAKCEVFNIAGGGIQYRNTAEILGDTSHTDDWFISTENRVYQFGCDDANSGCTELLLLAKNIPKSVCLQINRIQGIDNPNNDAPRQLEILEGSPYTGSYSTTINSSLIGGTNTTNESPQVKGKEAACVFEFGSSQNIYYFYQVLIAR